MKNINDSSNSVSTLRMSHATDLE